MNKFVSFLHRIKPSKRSLIQLYAALLYNANIKGFITGNIFTGESKGFCMPGMNCYSCPGAIGSCPLGSLQNALSSKNYKTITYVFGILLLYCITLGRTICGWFCPGGFFQDLLYKIPTPKIPKSKITRILSYFKYVLLGLLVIYIPIVFSVEAGKTIPGFCKYICPIGTFEGAIGLLFHPSNANYFDMLGPLFTWKFAILVVFIVLAIFLYRPFCRFFCPLGALYGLFNKISILGIKVNKDSCNHCGSCITKCKMDVKHVGDHECIMCGECIDVCKPHAINWKLIRQDIEAEFKSDVDLKSQSLKIEASANTPVLEADAPSNDAEVVEEIKDTNTTALKKKVSKKFIVNLVTSIFCVVTLAGAYIYANVDWNTTTTVSIGEKLSSLNISYYDDNKKIDLATDDKVTLLYFYDHYNEEEINDIYSTFNTMNLNIIAVSSYSNRELNKTYINSSSSIIYAYDTDSSNTLKSLGGNSYPYYAWLNKADEVMYESSNSFKSNAIYINAAVNDLAIGKNVGDLCYSMDINLLDKDGNKSVFNVSNNNGKVKVINFWYTECGPCVEELPFFNQLASNTEYADKIEVIAIHDGQIYEEDPNAYIKFLNERFSDFVINFGYDHDKSDYYFLLGGKGTYPMTVIVDADGIVSYNSTAKMTFDTLKSEVDKALNK